MWELFAGNGLFFFSDPAGAKACLALNEILKIENIPGTRRLISNKDYSFYSQFNSKVEVIENKDIPQITKNSGTPDWIFTGTSHPDSSKGFELMVLKIVNAKSYSFIDHWTNFKLRFKLNEELVLPDIIFVLDSKAEKMAVEDGLPKQKIRLFPNPYLEYLKKYTKPTVNRQAFCNTLKIPIDKKIVLYAPDPISLRSKAEKNELKVLEELLDLSRNNFTLLLKLHPLQPSEKIMKITEGRSDVKIIADKEFMPVDIFKNVDCIVGFYSNYLLEASTVNKNIISYIINPAEPGYLQHVLSSIVVNNKNELNLALKESGV
jgi:hypothetical protein